MVQPADNSLHSLFITLNVPVMKKIFSPNARIKHLVTVNALFRVLLHLHNFAVHQITSELA